MFSSPVFSFSLFLIGGYLLYNVVLVSALQLRESYRLPLEAPSHLTPDPDPLGHHRAPGWAHCVIQQIPTSYFTHGEGNGTPLQYSCLENPMDGGAWWAAVHGVPKSWTRLSNFTFSFHFHAVEKEMATHSSVLAWRIPGTGEPGGLLPMGSHRMGHDWSNLAAAAAVYT